MDHHHHFYGEPPTTASSGLSSAAAASSSFHGYHQRQQPQLQPQSQTQTQQNQYQPYPLPHPHLTYYHHPPPPPPQYSHPRPLYHHYSKQPLHQIHQPHLPYSPTSQSQDTSGTNIASPSSSNGYPIPYHQATTYPTSPSDPEPPPHHPLTATTPFPASASHSHQWSKPSPPSSPTLSNLSQKARPPSSGTGRVASAQLGGSGAGGVGKKKVAGASVREGAQPYLRKQQACLTCKRRKMRCDAVRPVCGACGRSQRRAARGHALTADVPPGDCVYPDEDYPASPSTSTTIGTSSLQAHTSSRPSSFSLPHSAAVESASSGESPSPDVGHTNQAMLLDALQDTKTMAPVVEFSPSGINGRSSPERVTPALTAPSALTTATDSTTSRGGSEIGNERIILEVQSSSGKLARIRRVYQSTSHTGEHPQMSLRNLINPTSGEEAVPFQDDDLTMDRESLAKEGDEEDLPRADLMLRQLLPDLTPDLPTPETIHHMAKLFFAKHPLRHMFSKRMMLARFRLPPNHPLRPHPSLIHAILALAEPFSPLLGPVRESDIQSGPSPGDQTGSASSGPAAAAPDSAKIAHDIEASGRGFIGWVNPLETPRPSIWKGPQLSFGEFHLAKARREVEIALLTSNERPLEWLQAVCLCLYALHERCRNMESLFMVACAARGMAPSGFDKMPNDRSDPGYRRGVMVPPATSIMDYEQRNGFWNVYLADVYGGGGARTYEPVFADEKNQITTTLPIRMEEVEEDTPLILSDQTLACPKLFRVGHRDSFCLHIKSASLLKRARLLASRRALELSRMAKPPEELMAIHADALDFFMSFPKREEGFDADWIVAEANTCVAVITLHTFFLDSTGLNVHSKYGRGPIERVSEILLKTIHYLLNSTYDFGMLHLQTFVAWVTLHRVLTNKLALLQRYSMDQQRSSSALDFSLDIGNASSLASANSINPAIAIAATSATSAPSASVASATASASSSSSSSTATTAPTAATTAPTATTISTTMTSTEASIESVYRAILNASERNWRAKNCLDICKAAEEHSLSDEEFADLVYLWQMVPAS